MPILTVLVVLIVVGVLLWLATTHIPMPAPYKKAVVVIVIVLVCIWLLQATGLLSGLSGARVGP